MSIPPTFIDAFEKLPIAEREQHLRGAVRDLATQKKILEDALDEKKKRLLVQGVIVSVRAETVLMATRDQGILSTRAPRHMRPMPGEGSIVWCNPETGDIYEVERDLPAIGTPVKVTRIVDEGIVEVRADALDGARMVLDRTKAKVGDEVLLDGSMSVVSKNLGPSEHTSELAFTEETGVTWDDIAGQESAKERLRETIEGPILHADLYREFGKAPCKGILLSGPPGNGKTLFAKAIATAIADRKGGKSSGFIYVKGPEVLHGIVGSSEGKVRKIFAAARDHHQKCGYPAVVCIDEADAIVGKRSDSKISMSATIVPQFLAEMDGIDPSGALVVLITNRPDTLDPAVTREGRIDLKVEIPRPDKKDAEAILAYHLGKRLCAPGTVKATLATETAAALFHPKHAMYMVRVVRGIDGRVGLDRFVSGAMCAGVVDRATIRAIRRFLDGEGDKGITSADLEAAVSETPAQIKALSHDEVLSDVLEEFGGKENVRRMDPV